MDFNNSEDILYNYVSNETRNALSETSHTFKELLQMFIY